MDSGQQRIAKLASQWRHEGVPYQRESHQREDVLLAPPTKER